VAEIEVISWLMDEVGPEGADLIEIPMENQLSLQEISRYELMRFPKRRKEWLQGRLASKKLLTLAVPFLAGASWDTITIANQPEGAPFVEFQGQRLPLTLSISHREGMAVAAVSETPGIRLGIDLEWVEPHPESFYQDFFTPFEQDMQNRANPERRAWLGTLIWSAKEAVLKALGTGLRLDTRTIEILDYAPTWVDGWGQIKLRIANDSRCNWQGFWLEYGNYLITMAVEGTKNRPVIHQAG